MTCPRSHGRYRGAEIQTRAPTSKRQVFATSRAPRGPGAERLRHPAERIAYPRSGEGGQGLEKAGGWRRCSTLPGRRNCCQRKAPRYT